VLEERIQELKAEFDRLRRTRTGLANSKTGKACGKIERTILKLEDKSTPQSLQMVDREAGKEIALGTRVW